MKSIRSTILIIIVCVFLFFIIVSHAVSRQILKNSFEKLERFNAQINIQRAQNALNAEIDSLYSINLDWAVWDESYRFMNEINTEFIEENLVPNFFLEQNMSFILFLKPSGALHWGRGYDFKKNEIKRISSDFSAFLPKQNFYDSKNENTDFRGITTIAGKSYVITSHKIFKTNHTGKPNGMLVMGKELSLSLIEKIKYRTSLNLVLYEKKSSDQPFWVKKAFDENGKTISGVIYPSEETIIPYIKLLDLKKTYSFIISAELERNIYKLGKETVKFFFVSLSLIGLVFSIIIFYLFETKVIIRVKNLGNQVKKLYQKDSNTRIVALDGCDELSFLANEINKMVKLLDSKSNSLESMAAKLKNMNTHLYELANTDSLTHLANRRNIFENLSTYIAIANRYNKNFCLCIFDIDDFKSINDNYGHNSGDDVLKDLAKTSSALMRNADKIARIGGEEFLILLSDTDINGAVSLCERLRLVIAARTLKFGKNQIKYTCSFGVTAYIKGKDSTDSIFMRADKHLYRAKNKGKNIVISDLNFYHAD
jgi:diguanylate cyclase (GGDEF)-like protein